MKKLLLILFCLPLIGWGQCISGDCENGHGTFTWSSGNKYIGEFIEGMRTGQGTFTWTNGDKYVGAFIENKRTGQGTLTWADGTQYVGEYKDGDRIQGTYTWTNGDKYVGAFIENKRTGQGTFTWTNGNKYVGAFIDGKRTGQGTFMWANGDKYIGAFIDAKRTGFGTYIWTNGNKYVGAFIDGKRIGQGTLTWADGTQYIGVWIDNKRTGQGTLIWPSGSKHVGEFKDGDRHGQGAFTNSKGEVQEGIWEYDKYIRENIPFKLSEGVIDHRLFTFIKSTNFGPDGRRDLKKLSQNGIRLDASLIEGLNDFPGCGCCDQSAFGIDEMFYFHDGGVLIIERHYAGDWESSEADWYEFYLYNPDKKKFERKLRLETTYPFAYNYRTGYIIDKESNPCGWQMSYTIYNNKFEVLGDFSPEPLRESNVDFYWNEKTNEVIFKREEGDIVLDIDKFSRR